MIKDFVLAELELEDDYLAMKDMPVDELEVWGDMPRHGSTLEAVVHNWLDFWDEHDGYDLNVLEWDMSGQEVRLLIEEDEPGAPTGSVQGMVWIAWERAEEE